MNTEVDLVKLGKVIRQMREQRPESLSLFARRIGITKSNMSRVERGLGNVSITTLAAISDGLGVTIDTLLASTPIELIPCPECRGSGWVEKK